MAEFKIVQQAATSENAFGEQPLEPQANVERNWNMHFLITYHRSPGAAGAALGSGLEITLVITWFKQHFPQRLDKLLLTPQRATYAPMYPIGPG